MPRLANSWLREPLLLLLGDAHARSVIWAVHCSKCFNDSWIRLNIKETFVNVCTPWATAQFTTEGSHQDDWMAMPAISQRALFCSMFSETQHNCRHISWNINSLKIFGIDPDLVYWHSLHLAPDGQAGVVASAVQHRSIYLEAIDRYLAPKSTFLEYQWY